MQSLYLFKKWLTKKSFLKQKMVDKKKLFLFQKAFFCQPFFEKIQGLGFPNKNGIFVLVFRRKTCVPSFSTGRDTRLENCPFSPLFPEKGQGRDTRLENLCPNLSRRKGAVFGTFSTFL